MARKGFAASVGWMSSTTSTPRGARRGNQKKTVSTICDAMCEPSSTTTLSGGASGRRMCVVHVASRKSNQDASPQWSRFAARSDS